MKVLVSPIQLCRLLVLLLVLLPACGPRIPPPRYTPGGAAPAEAVDRFLRLAAEHDYFEMGWVFGTRQGPILRRDPPADVERRMYAIARILDPEHFTIRGQSPIPGTVGTAVRVDVRLVSRGREYSVPFTTVRGPQDRWFVEQVALEAITGAR